ncbi:MAG: DUF3039 domain-containing protein [Acidimicrobiales bacterium]
MPTQAMPEIIEEVRPVLDDEGDHDRMAHIVVPASAVTEAIVTGKPCTALCGKVWVPTRDPKRYPVCATCKEVAASKGWKVPTG